VKVEEGRLYPKNRARKLRDRANDTVEPGKEAVARQAKTVVAAAEAAQDTYVGKSQTNGG
jgi:hypothetical protein